MSNSDPVETTQTNPVKPTNKKKYIPPKLTEYGTIGDITQSVGRNNASDGGSTTGMTKTAI